jgi:two-component system, response regulator PdtaR
MMELDHNRPAPPVILIVDDEPLLRMFAAEIVEEAGFAVLEAKDADEAVVILEARSDIVLLLTDINMPGSMDGLKLAHAVRNRWPPIKIVVVSGQMRIAQSDLPAGSRFFEKPYRTAAMIAELRSLVSPLTARIRP